MERNGHAGFVEPGPERIEVRIRGRASESGAGTQMHDTGTGREDAVEFTAPFVEIEQRQQRRREDATLGDRNPTLRRAIC